MALRANHAAPWRGRKVAALLAAAAAALPAGNARLDLDISVPPGSALEWGRAFPAITPRPGPLFPGTPGEGGSAEGAEGRTRAARTAELDLGAASTFGLLRILTWDLALHLEWVKGGWPELATPRTGSAASGYPEPSEAFYWVTVAPILRRLLHPAQVPGPEAAAHLVELGEPVLALLEVARKERGLGPLCDDVRRRVGGDPGIARRPLAREGARASMLSAFVLEELTATHPYDPSAGFGARLFLLGGGRDGELEQLVRAYARHPEPFTRRNAVAALARYGTREAAMLLMELARTSEDDVVLARALAGIGAYRGVLDPAPLLARLGREEDPVRRAALAGALGRLEHRSALEALLALAQEARRGAGAELLPAALAALARTPASREDRELARFLDGVQRAARRRPADFREEPLGAAVSADMPGTTRTRGELVAQLATLALARLELDAGAVRDVLALRGAPRADAAPGSKRALFGSGALGDVLPPAQHLWIETAARCGEPGTAALREIAGSRATEAALRAYALAHLPAAARAEVALAVLADAEEEGELAAHALSVLDQDRRAELVPHARALVARCAREPAGAGAPERRHLYLVALRALERRGELGLDELLALEHHVAAGGAGATSLRARLHAQALELARASVEGGNPKEIAARLGALLDFALESRANPHLEHIPRAVLESQIERALTDLSRRRRDEAALGRAAEAIVELVLGPGHFGLRGGGTRIDPRVLLEEEILLALGRAREPAARGLLERLAAGPDSPHRGAACLALGLAGEPASARPLVRALLSPDAFTRLCAAEALAHLRGTLAEELARVDWFAGPRAERHAAAERLFGRLGRAKPSGAPPGR